MARIPLSVETFEISAPTLTPIAGYAGFLFMGDLHGSSKRPGRRIDDYASACLDKLQQCVDICIERNLYLVSLGDLFHKAREQDNALQIRMMAILQKLRDPMIVIGGSHDRTETLFTEQDAAYLLEAAGVAILVDTPRKVRSFEMGGKLVHLWGIPTGCAIPDSIPGEDADYNLMVTHHDLDFHGSIPDFIQLKEIENCDILVNGHLHSPAPRVIVGRTANYNPGSTTRPSVDLLDHKPVASVWTPMHSINLESVSLRIADNVFDLTGVEVKAMDVLALGRAMTPGRKMSSFASILKGSDVLDARQTEDGTVLMERLDVYLKENESPPALKKYLTGLLEKIVEKKAAKA